MQNLNSPTSARVATSSETPVAPTVSKTFPAVLSASKAAGINSIRLSQINGDVLAEELNANQETIIGFRLHALVNSSKTITAIAITQLGSSPTTSPLTPAQRSALDQIGNELKEFKTSNTVNHSGADGPRGLHELSVGEDIVHALELAGVFMDCIFAIGEGGVNLLTDAVCLAGATAVNMEMYVGNNLTGTGDGSYGDNSGSDGVNSSSADDGDGSDGGSGRDPAKSGDPTQQAN